MLIAVLLGMRRVGARDAEADRPGPPLAGWWHPRWRNPHGSLAPTSWTQAWGPRPPYSHRDGQPLCPVIGPGGYRPAEPVRANRP